MSEVVLRRRKRTSRRSEAPVTTMWNDARMVRTHSIRAACHEILHMSKMRDLIKINIIGDPGSGKSTLAEVMAHIYMQSPRSPIPSGYLTRMT